jgi:hypothetical protein
MDAPTPPYTRDNSTILEALDRDRYIIQTPTAVVVLDLDCTEADGYWSVECPDRLTADSRKKAREAAITIMGAFIDRQRQPER